MKFKEGDRVRITKAFDPRRFWGREGVVIRADVVAGQGSYPYVVHFDDRELPWLMDEHELELVLNKEG
jgi:hypothetical protein